MAMRVTLSLDDDVAAELKKEVDQSGRSLEEALNASLRAAIKPRLARTSPKPFEVRAKALHARLGLNLDDIEELLEQAEGPAHR
jgi:hypothetical protein